MGRDGARVVTVNSIGREISEARQSRPPLEGQRLQLTIDYDLQKAAQDGFEVTGYQGLGDDARRRATARSSR